MFLNENVAIVTGGGRGIGRAIALELGRQGAKVVVNYSGNREKAEETVDLIKSQGGKGIAIQADVSQCDQVENLVRRTIDHFGKIDYLVNNAGITRDNLIIRMREEDWDQVLNTNLKSVYLCTKAVSKYMIKQRFGAIVNISSVVGIVGNGGQANYAASKAGIIGFTKSMAKELASRNIRVNAVAPGYISTEMTDNLSKDIKERILANIPLGFFGKPEHVAEAVLFLLSPKAEYITGQILCVDGGMTM